MYEKPEVHLLFENNPHDFQAILVVIRLVLRDIFQRPFHTNHQIVVSVQDRSGYKNKYQARSEYLLFSWEQRYPPNYQPEIYLRSQRYHPPKTSNHQHQPRSMNQRDIVSTALFQQIHHRKVQSHD